VIEMTLGEIAAVTGGRLDAGAAPATVVSGAVTFDSRAVEPGGLFVALAGERVDGHDFAAAAITTGAVAAMLAHPVDGVPAVIVDDPVIGLGRLARAVRDRAPELTVIGVTGSVGKTSTKDLLAAVLSRVGPTIAPEGNNNNELGVPLTTLKIDTGTRFLVAEMGARGIGHIAYLCGLTGPDLGVVLNVGTAHLSRFGGQAAIAQGKGELVEALAPAGLAVLNADDPLVAGMAARTTARVVFTSIAGDERAQITAERIRLDDQARAGFDLITPAGSAPVQLAVYGEHQVPNALAAAAVGIEVGLSPAEVAQALSGAGAASPWRMEVRRRPDGLVVVNDAYNANPHSMAAALRALVAMSGPSGSPASTRHWAVLGMMVDLGSGSAEGHRAIGRLAAELGLAGLIAVGPEAVPIAEGAAGSSAAGSIEVFAAPDLAEALALVQQNVRRTDVVLIKASRDVGLERLAADILADPAAASAGC
jgi:UDP-N-acetylmuramoyl-tripeptide--D-alanyl-D-alanine ligase